MRQIKITGGRLKGRSIEIDGRHGARFTPSKVREAIFNIIGDVEGKKILDLFAGSGSFAIEALSRGALSATCVEKEKEMCLLIGRNLQALTLMSFCDIRNMEVRTSVPFLYKKGYKYDIIFMDPPYEKGYVKDTVSLFDGGVMCAENGLLIVEHSKRESFEALETNGWEMIVMKRYGDTCVTMLKLQQHSNIRSL
jgi:16S rRNA (guanine966-N2)-methyltransferase